MNTVPTTNDTEPTAPAWLNLDAFDMKPEDMREMATRVAVALRDCLPTIAEAAVMMRLAEDDLSAKSEGIDDATTILGPWLGINDLYNALSLAADVFDNAREGKRLYSTTEASVYASAFAAGGIPLPPAEPEGDDD